MRLHHFFTLNEAAEDVNFDAEDLKRLEGINNLNELKKQAFALISKPSKRPMRPEKVSWFRQALAGKTNKMAVIKMMYDMMLSGEGHGVFGSSKSTAPSSYRRSFGEDADVKSLNEADPLKARERLTPHIKKDEYGKTTAHKHLKTMMKSMKGKHVKPNLPEAATRLERARDIDPFLNLGNGYWVGSMLHDDGDSRKVSYELYHTTDPQAAVKPMADQFAEVWRNLGFVNVSPYRATNDEIKAAAEKMIASDTPKVTEDSSTRKHLGPYDRGDADAYYGRRADPHKYIDLPNGNRQRVKLTDPAEINDYMDGYKNGDSGQKDWG